MDILVDHIGQDVARLVFGYLPISQKFDIGGEWLDAYEKVNLVSHTYIKWGGYKQLSYSLDEVKHRSDGHAVIQYYPNDQIHFVIWLYNDKRHRLDGPSWTEYYRSGRICQQEFYIHGNNTRQDGPALIKYFDNDENTIREETWMIRGIRHRILYSANIEYYPNGQIKEKLWLIHGSLHRENGPAEIVYHSNGKIHSAKWYYYGHNYNTTSDASNITFYSDGQIQETSWTSDTRVLHRQNEPALIEYFPDGQIKKTEWYNNGKCHRIGGPASIHYHPNGQVWIEEYLLFGSNKGCDGGLSREVYYDTGQKKCTEYKKMDSYHREDGPAFIKFDETGQVVISEWWQFGKLVRSDGNLNS